MPGLAPAVQSFSFLNGEVIDPIYLAAVEAVEEAVVNAIVAGEDVGGRGRCGGFQTTRPDLPLHRHQAAGGPVPALKPGTGSGQRGAGHKRRSGGRQRPRVRPGAVPGQQDGGC